MTIDWTSGGAPPFGSVEPAIRRVLDHIGEHFCRSVAADGTGRDRRAEPAPARDGVRNQVGVPPHRYLCRIRVQHARRLLGEGLPAALVAIDSGFCDQSHLSRHFKRQCGVTPGHFALAIRAGIPASFHPQLPQ